MHLFDRDAFTDGFVESEMNYSEQIRQGRQEVPAQPIQQSVTRTEQGTFHCALMLAVACMASLGRPALAQSLNHLAAEAKTSELSTAVTLHVDDNVFLNEIERAVRRAQWGHAVAVSHPVTSKLGATAELRYFTQPLTGGSGFSALWAANYSIRSQPGHRHWHGSRIHRDFYPMAGRGRSYLRTAA